jgi:hypothetical protein
MLPHTHIPCNLAEIRYKIKKKSNLHIISTSLHQSHHLAIVILTIYRNEKWANTMTVGNIPALHCCQYNLTVNAIIYCNCICIVKHVYASVFAILNDKLLTIYWTWQFPNFPIFSVFYSEVFQIYCFPFVPKTQQKEFTITVTYIPLMTAS